MLGGKATAAYVFGSTSIVDKWEKYYVTIVVRVSRSQ